MAASKTPESTLLDVPRGPAAMAQRSSKAPNGGYSPAELPIDGLPARVEPSYRNLRDKVFQARKAVTSYHALVRKAILAGRKEGYSNKRIAGELGCDASHVGRVIDSQLFRQKVAQARPEFPLESVSDSNWERLARTPEANAYELLDAAVGATVEGLRRLQRKLGTSPARDYRRRSRCQLAGGAESHEERVARYARALIRFEPAVSAGEGVAMAPHAE